MPVQLAELKKTAAFGRTVPLADTPLASGSSFRKNSSDTRPKPFGRPYETPSERHWAPAGGPPRRSLGLGPKNAPSEELQTPPQRRGRSLDLPRPPCLKAQPAGDGGVSGRESGGGDAAGSDMGGSRSGCCGESREPGPAPCALPLIAGLVAAKKEDGKIPRRFVNGIVTVKVKPLSS